jgi:multiple sugar transport system permease protein
MSADGQAAPRVGRTPEMTSAARRSRRRLPVGVSFVAPSTIVIAVVVALPILMSLYYSFTDFSLLGGATWAGLDNYVKLLSDEGFRRALWQTAIYTVISVPLQTILALMIADILVRRFRNRLGGVVRSVLFIPVMASLVLTGTVWRYLLAYDGGAVNEILGLFGIPASDWLGQSSTALIAIALVTVWKNVGYFLIIYYAGILDIPEDQYEASALDGAGPFRQLVSITMPALRPVTLLVVVLGTIWSFQVFDLIYMMTGGGPGGSTSTLVYEIYQAGFKEFQMGYASAMSVVLFVIILAASALQRFALARR